MSSIAIITPTRQREPLFNRMCQSVKDTATEGNVRVVSASNYPGDTYAVHEFSQNCPTVYMWNMLALGEKRLTDASLFMLGADDIVFSTKGWDVALLRSYDELENKIHCWHLLDSRNSDGTPHVIVSREWIEALGYFLPPLFDHFYVDTWTVEIAKANGVFTHLRDYLLIHDKPSDRGAPDSTHSRIRDNGTHARDKYVNDTCQHFLQYEIGRLSEKLYMGKRTSLGPRATGVYHEEIRQTQRYFSEGGK